MAQIELKLTSRETLGKKVSALRRQGFTPVHLFGHGIESAALQCETTQLQHVLAEAGKTGLINLKLNNEKRPRAAVVREVQTEPLTGELLHVDFYQVQMGEKVRVQIPIVVVGEAQILKTDMLVEELNTLTVECLPAEIPTRIELDLSSLTQEGQTVRVKDIRLEKDITVLNDPELMVARIMLRPIEKVEEKVVAEVPVEAAAEASEAAAKGEEETEEK